MPHDIEEKPSVEESSFYWQPHVPDGFDIKEIVDSNINPAIDAFVANLEIFTGPPGELFIYGHSIALPGGLETKMYDLRASFPEDLSDWNDDKERGIAWAEYLEKLATDIRTAVEKAK